MHTQDATKSNQMAIEINGLKKTYGRVQALKGISLAVRRGEIFGFLGPNGAGKTTTIRCLLDTIRPDSGKVRILGFDPRSDPIGVQARTGYLPGEVQFFDNFTAERQLRYFNDMRGQKADWHHAMSLAARLNLDIKKQIKNMSKGNKQKIGVIQALMHRPEILILDEPTSGLDPLMQQTVLALLREASQAGATVFFSSHIMSEVETIAERVGIIRTGEIIEVAETKTLTQHSLTQLTIRFKQPVDCTSFERVDGVTFLSSSEDNLVHLQVAGDMDPLVKFLAGYPVFDLETTRPTLEEVFLAYYVAKNENH